MNKENNRIEEILDTALTKIKSMLDITTVVGEAKIVDNSTIVPVSKVTIGLLTGGGEYGPQKTKNTEENLAGGLGTVTQINPIGFLVYKENDIKFIKVDSLEIQEKIIDVVTNTIQLFSNKKRG